MRYFIFIILSIIALNASPRKYRAKHCIPKMTESQVEKKEINVRIDTINSKKYSEYVVYEDSIPIFWEVHHRQHEKIYEGSDPRKITVYFNPAAPKFFHAFHDCKKLGAFRKLTESPIEEFLKKNHSAAICPDCNAKSNTFYFIVQFLLDEKQ